MAINTTKKHTASKIIEIIDRIISWQKKRREEKKRDSNVEFNSIPFACHYCDDTVMLQTGDMVQTIEIGVKNNPDILDALDNVNINNKVRGIVVSLAKKSIMDIAFSLHTERRGHEVAELHTFHNTIARRIHVDWCNHIKVDKQFVTTVYISVVVAGLREKISKLSVFLEYLIPSLVKYKYMKDASKLKGRLDVVTEEIIKSLAPLRPKKLKIIQKDGKCYSEIAESLSHMLNLAWQAKPLSTTDLTYHFTNGRLKFGFNTFEIAMDSQKKFGCMLGLKESIDTSREVINFLTTLNNNMLITENLTLTKKTRKMGADMQYKQYLLRLSNSESMLKDMCAGADCTIDSAQPILVSRNISIMPLESSLTALSTSVNQIYQAFSSKGFILYRHDLGMEQIFWSQIPGNISYSAHKRIIYPSHAVSFLNVTTHCIKEGWGLPVTYMLMQNGTQVPIVLHHEGVGHTAILGHDNKCLILANFLIAQMQKFNPHVLYIDFNLEHHRTNRILLKLLGGRSTNDYRSKEFLRFFSNIADGKIDKIDHLIACLDTLDAFKLLSPDDSASSQRLRKSNELPNLLHFAVDAVDSNIIDNVIGLVGKIQEYYKNPMVIVINNPYIGRKAKYLSEQYDLFANKMAQLNVVIFSIYTQTDNNDCLSYIASKIKYSINQFFTPTINAREHYSVLGLDAYAVDWLRMIARKGVTDILVKQKDKLNALQFNYDGLGVFSLLAPDDAVLDALEKYLQEYGDDVDSWAEMIAFE